MTIIAATTYVGIIPAGPALLIVVSTLPSILSFCVRNVSVVLLAHLVVQLGSWTDAGGMCEACEDELPSVGRCEEWTSRVECRDGFYVLCE